MTPCGEAKQYYWPAREDTCWIEQGNILCTVQTPVVMSSSVRGYSFTDTDIKHILQISSRVNKDLVK